jgi:hypothetical protein
MKVKIIAVAVLFLLGVTACQKNDPDLGPPSLKYNTSLEQSLVKLDIDLEKPSGALKGATVDDWWVPINEALAEHNLQLEKMETLAPEDAEEAGVTFYFKEVGNKQLLSDFVPNDPRNGTGIDVPYVIDATELGTSSGMSVPATYSAIVSAMTTWDEVKCSSGLNIPFWGAAPFDIGYVQFLAGMGGIDGYFPGAIVHGGILPPLFFEIIGGPGGGTGILGVTFTFIWIDEEGNPTDINNDGKEDVAIKEIYINDAFPWADDPNDVPGNGVFDFESVVLHEVGHGLCQAHFGKAFWTKKGELKFAPAALMNPVYFVAWREITKTDLAGHCSVWDGWPEY